jgi:hypothetical protein
MRHLRACLILIRPVATYPNSEPARVGRTLAQASRTRALCGAANGPVGWLAHLARLPAPVARESKSGSSRDSYRYHGITCVAYAVRALRR